MKLRFPLIASLILLLTLQIFTQEKPQALKFDEFEVIENSFYADPNELTFSQRIEKFSEQLKKERNVRAYIIYYQARVMHENNQRKFNSQVGGIEYKFKYNERIKVKDVLILNGGYRENNSVEFWIVPEDAELPVPTPIFEKEETAYCPNISVNNETPLNQNETARFSVSSYEFKEIDNYSLTWRVSVGEIVQGQGTNKIDVKLNDSDVKRVTSYLEVSGLPFPCPKVFSTMAEVNEKLSLVDSFGVAANGYIRSLLDSFAVNLQNNPTAKGYVVIYGGRIEGRRDAARRETLIRNHFRFRNFDESRITFIRGGFRETVSTDLWLAFDNAVPIPTPTVDEKFVVIPKPKAKPRSRKK